VTLLSQPGASGNSGHNICQLVLDDEGTNAIQSVTSASAPFTGRYKPSSPLSAFDGQNANGTWTLNVSDRSQFDTGSIRAFSLRFNSQTGAQLDAWWLPDYLNDRLSIFGATL